MALDDTSSVSRIFEAHAPRTLTSPERSGYVVSSDLDRYSESVFKWEMLSRYCCLDITIPNVHCLYRLILGSDTL